MYSVASLVRASDGRAMPKVYGAPSVAAHVLSLMPVAASV